MTPVDDQARELAQRQPGPFVGVVLQKAAYGMEDQSPFWNVFSFHSLQALTDWFGGWVGSPTLYVYIAKFDKSVSPEPIAFAPLPDGRGVGVQVGKISYGQGAVARLASFIGQLDVFWAGVAQHNASSQKMQSWMKERWDPFYTYWLELLVKHGLSDSDNDVIADETVALDALMEDARKQGIPLPESSPSVNGQFDSDRTIQVEDNVSNSRDPWRGMQGSPPSILPIVPAAFHARELRPRGHYAVVGADAGGARIDLGKVRAAFDAEAQRQIQNNTGPLYLLLASRVAEGQPADQINAQDFSTSKEPIQNSFDAMSGGREDGAPTFAYVAIYTIDGSKIVWREFWYDRRFIVNPLDNVDPIAELKPPVSGHHGGGGGGGGHWGGGGRRGRGRRFYGGGGWGYDGWGWGWPYYGYYYPYVDDDDDDSDDDATTVGRYREGEPSHQRGVYRRLGLLAQIAPVLAPATNGIAVKLDLDANQMLHAIIRIDGTDYKTSVDLAPGIAAVMAKLAQEHEEWHQRASVHPLVGAGVRGGQRIPVRRFDQSSNGYAGPAPDDLTAAYDPGTALVGGDATGAVRTYGGVTQSAISAIVSKMRRTDGYTVEGSNPWDVDTDKHGVKLRGTWNASQQTLTVEVTDSGFGVSANAVWEVMDAAAGEFGATVVSGGVMLGAMNEAVRAAGDTLIGALVERHIQTACAGWWHSLTSDIKGAAKGLESDVGKTLKALKGPIATAATAAAGAAALAIPGVGPLVAPIAGKLAGDLVNAATGSGSVKQAAQAAVAQATQAAQSDPNVAAALTAAHNAVAQTTTAYHVAQTLQSAAQGNPAAVQQVKDLGAAAAQGDPAAQQAMNLANQVTDAATSTVSDASCAISDATSQGWPNIGNGRPGVWTPRFGADGHHYEILGADVSQLAGFAALAQKAALTIYAERGVLFIGFEIASSGADLQFFGTRGDAERWFAAEAADPEAIYVAYFDASDHTTWPNPVNIYWSGGSIDSSPSKPHVGIGPRVQIVGAAIDVLRKQAQIGADGMPANVVGVLRTPDGMWHLPTFASPDDADDWFGNVTHEPSSFIYAAYFDKNDRLWPAPLNESIGHAQAAAAPSHPIPRGIAEVP